MPGFLAAERHPLLAIKAISATVATEDFSAYDAPHLDDIRSSVLYQNRERDAPATINVTLDGQPYAMHASFGDNLDHASRVTYHLVARDGELSPPMLTLLAELHTPVHPLRPSRQARTLVGLSMPYPYDPKTPTARNRHSARV